MLLGLQMSFHYPSKTTSLVYHPATPHKLLLLVEKESSELEVRRLDSWDLRGDV